MQRAAPCLLLMAFFACFLIEPRILQPRYSRIHNRQGPLAYSSNFSLMNFVYAKLTINNRALYLYSCLSYILSVYHQAIIYLSIYISIFIIYSLSLILICHLSHLPSLSILFHFLFYLIHVSIQNANKLWLFYKTYTFLYKEKFQRTMVILKI